MRIHCLQHVPFEGPAGIGDWAARRGHSVSTTRLYAQERPPSQMDFDWLVVMGGPMGVCDEAEYAWMQREKALIRESIGLGKTVLGVCLGAQLIADALGAQVYRNAHREIGWFPIELMQVEQAAGPLASLPRRLQVFHWHGDTFDLPDGAVHLARSEACENQAFLYGGRVLGLQFHLESTPESVASLVANCGSEIVQGDYVQGADRILAAGKEDFSRISRALFEVLNRLAL